MLGQQNDNSWSTKKSSAYEIYLDKAIEACIENCSPPPPKPKHYRDLTALSFPPPAENLKKVSVWQNYGFVDLDFLGTLFLLPISVYVYACVSVWRL